MPYPNYHAARLRDPSDFIQKTIRSKPIENGDILLILGKLKSDGISGSMKTQSIRFKASKYTVAQAKKWLKDHDYKPILFEPAKKAEEDKKEEDKKCYYKKFPFEITETKELKTEEGHYGIIKGYASTYGNVDRGGDIVRAGAFTNSLERYKIERRPIKMQYQHSMYEIIGGFPCDEITEDEKGLFVTGYINLDVQRGREVYALAKQGVLSDMSIGFSIHENERLSNGNLLLKELELWEISVVGEPMNTEAKITMVKSKFNDLPLAFNKTLWDSEKAIERVKDFSGSDYVVTEDFKNAFMIYDKENPNDFDGYKLQYADVIDGKLTVIPKAIFGISAIMKSNRNNLNISEEEEAEIKSKLNKYYEKMGLESPLKSYYDNTIVCKDIAYISTKEDIEFILKNFDVTIDINNCRETEKNLRDVGFSKQAANLLISVYKKELGEPVQKVANDNDTEVIICLEQVCAKLSRIAKALKK